MLNRYKYYDNADFQRTWFTEVCLISLLVIVQGVLPPFAVKPGCKGRPVKGSIGSNSRCLKYIRSSVPELLLSCSPSLDNGGDTTQSCGTPAKGVLVFRTDPPSKGCHVASCKSLFPFPFSFLVMEENAITLQVYLLSYLSFLWI